jgi:cytochrome c oxidase cbb3-type subunit 1
MIGQLTKNERQIALIILLGLAVCGLAMAVAGRHDPVGGHGALILSLRLQGYFSSSRVTIYRNPRKSGTTTTTTIQPKPASFLRWVGPYSACLSAIG